ncbi:sulfatase family protein [Pelagicoccus mobilis]|uniref:Sulfatase n=1 Tax=Pelagicoccus mobilis TaxID=415221 RepID=A0A934RXX6_9BACT|nr:sulfatase [Pelagicoccus mobilis]MBK1877274.1 sulfatase [Pelagicoccus mobilis]
MIMLRIALLLVLFGGALLRVQGGERPNILLFITDDESWLERSAYGWSPLPTPAFDKVAEQGALFTNGYTSAPSCAPARASVLAGRNFWELEQGAFIQAYVPKTIPVFTHLLHDAGYHVGYTDKGWGPGVVNEDSHDNLFVREYNEIEVENQLPDLTPYDYVANFERFLEDRKEAQPFFFWAGVTEPHDPMDPKNYLRLEKEYGLTLDDIPMPPVLEDTRENRINRANILYEICYADLQLQKMIDLLEAKGELDNTLLIVTSDNGTVVVRDGQLFAKASAYDYGVHIPLAVMWPSRMEAGRTVTDFVNFRDFAPTFLELAGVEKPQGMSGESLLPILLSGDSGQIDPERNWMMTGLEWHGEFDPQSRSSRSIREGRYSLIFRYSNVDEGGKPLPSERLVEPSSMEFYDLATDPWEMKNLADDPKYAVKIRSLSEKMKTYGLQTSDPRFTGEMDLFVQTRRYVLMRKRIGYEDTFELPFNRAKVPD